MQRSCDFVAVKFLLCKSCGCYLYSHNLPHRGKLHFVYKTSLDLSNFSLPLGKTSLFIRRVHHIERPYQETRYREGRLYDNNDK